MPRGNIKNLGAYAVKGKSPRKGKVVIFSSEHRANLSKANKGRKLNLSDEQRKKRSLGLLGNKRNLGKKASDETRLKMSLARKGKIKTTEHKLKLSERKRGEKNPMWEGGKSFEKYPMEWTDTLKESIRQRDKYICRVCGSGQTGKALHIHHIDTDKKNCDPRNLIAICNSCHMKIHRKLWKK